MIEVPRSRKTHQPINEPGIKINAKLWSVLSSSGTGHAVDPVRESVARLI